MTEYWPQGETAEVKPVRLLSYKDLPDEEGNYLIAQMLPERGLGMIWGDRSVGKSFIALDLALSVASGRKWLGRFETGPQRGVVYILNEGVGRFRRRVDGWLAHRNAQLSEISNFRICTEEITVGPTKQKTNDVMRLIDTIKKEKKKETTVGLFLLDTFSLALRGEENSNADINAACQQLRKLADETGAAVLIVHHAGKGWRGSDGQTVSPNSARGGSALEAAADTIWHVRRMGSVGAGHDRVIMKMTKQRDDEPLDLAIEFHAVERNGRKLGKFPELVGVESGSEAKGSHLGKSQMRLLEAVIADGGKRQSDYCKPAGVSKSTVSKICRTLLEKGLLIRTKIGIQATKLGEEAARGKA